MSLLPGPSTRGHFSRERPSPHSRRRPSGLTRPALAEAQAPRPDPALPHSPGGRRASLRPELVGGTSSRDRALRACGARSPSHRRGKTVAAEGGQMSSLFGLNLLPRHFRRPGLPPGPAGLHPAPAPHLALAASPPLSFSPA